MYSVELRSGTVKMRNAIVDWALIATIIVPSLLSFIGGAITEKEAQIVNNYIYLDNNTSKVMLK